MRYGGGLSYIEIAQRLPVGPGEVVRLLVGIHAYLNLRMDNIASDVDFDRVLRDVTSELERRLCAEHLRAKRSGDDILASLYITWVVRAERYWSAIAAALDGGFENLPMTEKAARLNALRQQVHRLKRQVPCFRAWFESVGVQRVESADPK